MRVLIVEDNALKHSAICKVLKSCGVTDMWYPKLRGGPEAEAGDALITLAKEEKWIIPIILCSSVKYRMSEIFGTLYYSERSNWEDELRDYIKQIKKV